MKKEKNNFWRIFLSLAFISLIVCSQTKAQITYQAEDYSSQSGTSISTSHAGYLGSAFIDFGGNGTWIEWNDINEGGSGSTTLTFRYANASSSNRQCQVLVNDVSQGNVSFTPTGSWSNWDTASISISLASGNNTIRVTANTSSGGPNLDQVIASLIDSPQPDPPASVRNGFLPNASWLTEYDTRVSDYVNSQIWNFAGTNVGDQDNGKRFWPRYLAELKKGNTTTAYLAANNRGVYTRWEGSVYKPFSAPGLLYYYFGEATPEHKTRIESHWNGSLYGNGRDYSSRTDGQMDPIYNCTEFNSENFNWMARIYGYMMSNTLNDNSLIEGTQAKSWFENYMKNLTKATFNTGRVEWNSQIYTGFCLHAIEPVYQFATWDPAMQDRAAAVMDWLALETALHYVDGNYVGPKSRGKGIGFQAQQGSIAPYYNVWFNGGSPSDLVNPDWSVGFIDRFKYRPLQVIVDIANRNFNTPVEIQSAKPYYHLDNANYAQWQGDDVASRRFEFETIWIDDNYTMASVATNRPRGENTFSEQELWGIAVKQSTGYALQVFGNANNNNNSADNTSNIHSDVVGRSPFQEIGQFRNTMMQLIKGGSNQYIYVPTSKTPAFDGNRMFVDMGSGVYIAVSPYNSTGQTSQTKTGSDGINYTRFQWNFPTSLGALVIETGTASQHGSFANFKNSIKNNTTLTSPSSDVISYTSTQTNEIKMEWVPTSTYTYLHTDCSNITVNPAGVVSKVWGNNQLLDFETWDSYNVSFGDNIVEQPWGGGSLKMNAGGTATQITVDNTTAEVAYSAYSLQVNQPPTVQITSPSNGATFTEGDNITISATASDSDGSVTSVQFFNGSTSLGTDNSAPYSISISNASAGTYNLTAVATDNVSASTTSSVKTITVNPPSGGTGEIVVRAKMISGASDILELRLDNQTVHSWTVSGSSYADYAYSNLSGSSNVKIWFRDQGTDIQLDNITINNATVLQAEAQQENTSVWENGSCGGDYSEKMHCTGHINFGTINFGGQAQARSGDSNSMGMEEASALDFSIYPNPTSGTVYLNIESKTPGNIYIFNTSGTAIYSNKYVPGDLKINMEGFSQGLYFINIQTENKVVTKKMILK